MGGRRRRRERDPWGQATVEVVLVPEDESGPTAAPGPTGDRTGPVEVPGPDEPGALPPRGRRRRWTALVACLALVGGLVVAQVVEDERAEARARAFAAMPGTVPALDEPLSVVWSHADAAGAVRAGRLVLMSERGAPPSVRAVEVGTGEERWRLERPGSLVPDRCFADRTADVVDRVLCWRTDGGGRSARGWVTIVDADDGTVLAEYRADAPSHGAAVVGGDLVSAEVEEGRLRVRRTDLVTQEERWSTMLEPSGSRELARGGTVRAENGWVVLVGATTAVLDAADGRVLGRWEAGGYTRSPGQLALDGAEVRTSPEGFGAWSSVASGRRSPYGEWFDRDGRRVSRLEGQLAEPGVTDGSAPGVLLSARTDTGELLATDLDAGEVVWRTELRGGHVLVRRDGAAVVAHRGDVRALDLRTGVPRWSARVGGLRGGAGAVTDGTTLVVVAERGRGPVLVALGLDDGAVRWEVPGPGGRPVSDRSPTPDGNRSWIGEVGGRPVMVVDRLIAGLG